MITPDVQTTVAEPFFGDHVLFVSEPMPHICGDNGHFTVSDGVSNWLVIVTEEALAVNSSDTEGSLQRLNRFIKIYCRMAEAALAQNEDVNGTIWIFEKDVLAFGKLRLPAAYTLLGSETPAIKSPPEIVKART